MSLFFQVPSLPLDSWIWPLFEDYLYRLPEPPPRVRTQPMQVLCLGMSRTGTESLSRALEILGIPTYHGWDALLEEPTRMPGWKRLLQRKWFGDDGGREAADFDRLLGHRAAVADVPAYAFAPELIAAYPDAKVVLNQRLDADGWLRSMDGSITPLLGDKAFYFASWFEARTFWAYHYTFRWHTALTYRLSCGNWVRVMRQSGPWVVRDHCNMVRGAVPPERLLEWTVDDGWEPLCKFLGKEVPKEPFPHANAAGPQFDTNKDRFTDGTMLRVIRNFVMTMVVTGGMMAWLWTNLRK
ncbi:hypothetical protein F5X96DRAFT_683474 [Biscogniauxia mediterranea]|nr:hypothetical protein F5X96DRAFT_683474 [Biscogniauxia mediterranea]